MHAAPARYVSVSELYSADEVELLLDEIRELEPTSCRGEDVQDFEIAGSGLGACGAGGRSPCGTELTERSWDSHAHYSRAPPPRPRHVAPLYCRLRYLLSLAGALTLLIVVSSLAACACVWALVGVRAWLLPLAGRVRLLLLGALTSALLHAALLLMHVSRLTLLLPLDWTKLGLWSCVWSGVSLVSGGALTLHAVLAAPEYRAAPPHVARLLLAAAGLGLSAACCALVAVGWLARGCQWSWRLWVPGGLAGPPGSRAGPPSGAGSSSRALYRAVPAAPPAAPAPAPQPSTSRDNPL